MARALAPTMVVLEDVDLIAQERGQPFQPTGPLLFELLNEMDGLRDDCDVIFVLTTNRARVSLVDGSRHCSAQRLPARCLVGARR